MAEVSDGGISGDMAVSHLLHLLYLTLSFSLERSPASSLLLTLCEAVAVFGRWPSMFIAHQTYTVCGCVGVCVCVCVAKSTCPFLPPLLFFLYTFLPLACLFLITLYFSAQYRLLTITLPSPALCNTFFPSVSTCNSAQCHLADSSKESLLSSHSSKARKILCSYSGDWRLND